MWTSVTQHSLREHSFLSSAGLGSFGCQGFSASLFKAKTGRQPDHARRKKAYPSPGRQDRDSACGTLVSERRKLAPDEVERRGLVLPCDIACCGFPGVDVPRWDHSTGD